MAYVAAKEKRAAHLKQWTAAYLREVVEEAAAAAPRSAKAKAQARAEWKRVGVALKKLMNHLAVKRRRAKEEEKRQMPFAAAKGQSDAEIYAELMTEVMVEGLSLCTPTRSWR